MATKLSPTEERNPHSFHLDELSSMDFVHLMNDEDETLIKSIRGQAKELALSIDLARETLGNGHRIIYIGAGTSGRLGVLDASECPPTFSSSPDQVVGIIAGGDVALRNSIEGAEDNPKQAISDLNLHKLLKDDLVIGIAASGNTPYVVGAIEYAHELGAKTISISNNPYGKLANLATINIVINSGPEVLTGSTRLKAGTSQKIALNMISTGAMVALGKAYENLMIDVAPSNEKLIKRCNRIVMQATDCSEQQAIDSLNQCNYHPKTAILMILADVSAGDAAILLKDKNGNLRQALS